MALLAGLGHPERYERLNGIRALKAVLIASKFRLEESMLEMSFHSQEKRGNRKYCSPDKLRPEPWRKLNETGTSFISSDRMRNKYSVEKERRHSETCFRARDVLFYKQIFRDKEKN